MFEGKSQLFLFEDHQGLGVGEVGAVGKQPGFGEGTDYSGATGLGCELKDLYFSKITFLMFLSGPRLIYPSLSVLSTFYLVF